MYASFHAHSCQFNRESCRGRGKYEKGIESVEEVLSPKVQYQVTVLREASTKSKNGFKMVACVGDMVNAGSGSGFTITVIESYRVGA